VREKGTFDNNVEDVRRAYMRARQDPLTEVASAHPIILRLAPKVITGPIRQGGEMRQTASERVIKRRKREIVSE
jgi:hypothetical protein